MSSDTKNPLGALGSEIQKMLAETGEMVGGQDVARLAASVDLEDAYSPVLAFRGETEPVEANKTEDGDYLVCHPAVRDPVGPAELRVMRARFLAQKAAYTDKLDTMAPVERRRVMGHFFRGVSVPRGGKR